jgi:hypothetical protein
MRKTRTICVCAAAFVAASMLPASAQMSSSSTSFEGASAEMQKRGPRSDMLGPDQGGRYIVTEPGYRYGYRYHRRAHRAPVYGYYR